MYTCVNSKYTEMSEEFNSVEEFIDMCEKVFDETPFLYQQDNDWYDYDGIVLRAKDR